MSENHTNYVEGPLSGDSIDKLVINDNSESSVQYESVSTTGAIVYDHAGGAQYGNRKLLIPQLAVAAGGKHPAFAQLIVGDMVVVRDGTADASFDFIDVFKIVGDNVYAQLSTALGRRC